MVLRFSFGAGGRFAAMHHTGAHDPLLVTLSLFIAIATSFTALDLFGRVRTLDGLVRSFWLLAAAIAMGGGIWAMHFVGMLAFHVPGVEFEYAFGLTAVSFVLPIAAAALGFEVAARRASRPVPLLVGGAIMGLAIATMHYTGMAAVRFAGEIHYLWPWVAVSIAIAIIAATTALWIANLDTRVWQRVVAAIVMGLAIAGMHYTAMHGVDLHVDASGAAELAHGMSRTTLAGLVTGATLLVLLLTITASGVDRQFAARSQRDAARLRASEERLQLILRSVTDHAISMLDREGRVANWNTGAARIFGYTSDEIIGAHISLFHPPEEQADGLAERALRVAAAENRFEHDGWLVRKDGSRFWGSMILEPVRDDGGTLVGFVKVCRDNTDRRQTQQALEEAREALFQAQKMDAVGQLTGGVAHDFNNLLTAVLGSLELLRKRLPDDPRAQRLLENAMLGAQRGAALTQRMLAFARRQDLRLEAVDVAALVRGMRDLFERTIEPHLRIDTQFPPDAPTARADANQLELALLNLVVNARDAMPDGGAIAICVRTSGATPPSELSAGDYVCISVEDNGVGMSPETLARAQEPFFTTKGVGKGTGLGLPMVRGFAEQCGGAFRLSSVPGQGTRAEIWLPLANHAAAEDAVPRDMSNAPARQRRFTIMVVDDDPLVLENTSAMLDDLGHIVIEARSAEEALDLLGRTGTLDLVITDQAMPGMSGLELVERILASRPTMPIVLATGFADLTASLPVRHDVCRLNKPFDQASLRRAIDDALGDRTAEGGMVVDQPTALG